MAQSVERLTSAQVMISRSVSSSPVSVSGLMAQSLESASDSVVSLSLSASSQLCLSLSLKNNKHQKKIKVYLFREREREREGTSGVGTVRKGETIPSRLHTVSVEPDAGLHRTPLRS